MKSINKIGLPQRLHINQKLNYFQILSNSKRYPLRKRCTLPVKIDKDSKEAKQNNNNMISIKVSNNRRFTETKKHIERKV